MFLCKIEMQKKRQIKKLKHQSAIVILKGFILQFFGQSAITLSCAYLTKLARRILRNKCSLGFFAVSRAKTC